MKVVLGVDPGQKGGYCWMQEDRTVLEAGKLPHNGKDVDVRLLLGGRKPDLFVVEDQWVRPTDPPKTATVLMRCFGQLLGAALIRGLAIETVPPKTWQNAILGKKILTDTKTASIMRCTRRFPGVDLKPGRCTTPQDGIADAVNIADYGVGLLTGE